jgi:CRP-like cAMP-binding protein
MTKSEIEVPARPEDAKSAPDPSRPDFVRDPAFAHMLSTLRPIHLEPDQVLVAQGEPSDAAYYLESGAVGVYAETPYGAVPLATHYQAGMHGKVVVK